MNSNTDKQTDVKWIHRCTCKINGNKQVSAIMNTGTIYKGIYDPEKDISENFMFIMLFAINLIKNGLCTLSYKEYVRFVYIKMLL